MDTLPLKIGVLGTGRMAGNLGKLWVAQGHQVFFGSREAQKARALAESVGPNAKGGTLAEAVAFGEVILLAVPWLAAEATLKTLGSLAGKILVDITNAVKPSEVGPQLALDYLTTSAAEEVARQAPGAKVVKAFNSIYFENLARPQFGEDKASSFFCGDDAQAKAVVARLSRDIGFEPVDCGPLTNARLLEPLAILWMQLASARDYGPDIAFKLLKR